MEPEAIRFHGSAEVTTVMGEDDEEGYFFESEI